MAAARPRVLHVLEALEGGTARHLVDVVSHACPATHAVAIPARRIGGLTDEHARGALVEAGAAVHLVPMTRSPLTPTNVRALGRLNRLVGSLRPDVIHAHSSIGGVLGRLVAARAELPAVYTPNGIARSPVARRAERLLGRRTARIVAVSASEAELVGRLRLVAPDAVTTIPNGLDLDHRPTPIEPTTLGVPPGAPTVGTIARLVDQKSPLVFVDACRRLGARRADIHFVLVGDGPLRPQVERAVASAGLAARFHLVPELPGAAGLLGRLDVFVLVSGFEGAPYSPMEAMRAGTPVVLSDVVGNRDLVESGVDGALVPADDPAAAATAVEALLDDPTRRATMAAAAAERLAREHDVRDMGTRLARLYAELS